VVYNEEKFINVSFSYIFASEIIETNVRHW